MKITHQTSEVLVFEQKPAAEALYILLAIVLGCFVLGVIFTKLPPFATIVGIFFPLCMLPIILRETTATFCTFDRRANLLTLNRKNWFRQNSIRHRLSEIRDVQIKSSVTTAGESQRVEVYEIGLVLNSGAYLQLNKPTIACDRDRTEPIFATIRDFIR